MSLDFGIWLSSGLVAGPLPSQPSDAWYESLAAEELSWIEQGLAVDQVFRQKFSESPESIKTDRDTGRAEAVGTYRDPVSERYWISMLICSILSVLIVTTLVVLAIRLRREPLTREAECG